MVRGAGASTGARARVRVGGSLRGMATTPRPRRGPYAKTRGRVEAVGEIAYDVVVEQGHRALTMAEVARRSLEP